MRRLAIRRIALEACGSLINVTIDNGTEGDLWQAMPDNCTEQERAVFTAECNRIADALYDRAAHIRN